MREKREGGKERGKKKEKGEERRKKKERKEREMGLGEGLSERAKEGRRESMADLWSPGTGISLKLGKHWGSLLLGAESEAGVGVRGCVCKAKGAVSRCFRRCRTVRESRVWWRWPAILE